MDELNYEYECALSGLTTGGSAPDPLGEGGDKLGDMPVGWTRIRITRRQFNPKWLMIQHTKEQMVRDLIQQTQATERMAQISLTLQVEAQMAPLEKATPMYMPDVDDVVYLSDEGDVLGALNSLREELGLATIAVADEDEDDEDDEAAVEQDDGPEELEVGDTPEEDDSEDEDEDDEEA